MNKFILCLLFLLSTSVFAADTPTAPPAANDDPYPRTPYRSDANSLLWVDLNLGLIGDPSGLGGLQTEGGLGAFVNTNLRLQLGRCGPMINMRNESIYHWDPVHVNNYLYGAGVFCRIVRMEKWKATRGAHLDAHALYDYGKSTYSFDDGQYYKTRSGTAYGGTGVLGADLYMPLWFGFWAGAGVDLEFNGYRYTAISETDGSLVTSSSNTTLFGFHMNLTYSFL